MNGFSDASENRNNLVYNSLKNKRLKTYKDIYPEFKEKFQHFLIMLQSQMILLKGRHIHFWISLILLEIMIIEKVFIE